ncbi:hypothetical protein GCM10023085_75520 [Actinomadura viridis]|uniref:DUF4190 domain-containing protein n=1 Tax=Actinomadura viridis TaxID=58110 RepID=A0A931D8V0_9ACTN|nr:hypothetical protein [Actinomadura viridis]MBG6086564.1 hypothetical protein [Actinomadura viridis]
MSEQPGQGDDGTGREFAPATGGPAGPDGGPDRSGWRALWLGGGALLLTPFFFPVGLFLGIAALVVGIRARRRAGRRRVGAPGAVGGIVLGAIGLAMASFWFAVTAFLWTELNGYQTCLTSANTTTDEKNCRDRYFTDIEKKLNLPAGSMSRYGDMF